jgi:hypothetical protein
MDTIDELGRRAARTALAEAEAYTDVEAGLARILADEEDVDWNVDGGSRRGWVVVLAAAAAVVAAVTAGVVWSQEDPSPRLVPGTSPEVTPAPTTPATPELTTPATPAPTTPTTEAPTTTTPPTTTSLPPDDSSPLATLAEAIGASTAIATEPGKVSVFTAGTTMEVATPRDAYVQTDGDFLWWYIITGETSRSAAATLDGTIVCEVEGAIHRVRQEADGGYVASVERPDEIAGIGEEIAVPNYAVDCDTGAIEPIEPVSWRWEVGTRRIERIGDSTFTSSHDAEGNGDVTNEAGISINGDDYAGQHTFSADGSRVVYGDMDALATPHVTNVLRSRDTTSGELLWSAELDRPVGLTYWYGDRIVALAPADGVPGGPYEAVIVLDALTGDVIETVPTTLDLAFVD